MQLFTIGYEGASIEDFVETLDCLGVERVIDIRDLPASRKRDFSKNILKQHLLDADMEYSHFKALGDPKEGREAMRAGDRAKFLEVFSAQMKKPEAESALEQLTSLVLDETCVLLCYERDYKNCHRSIVAREIGRRSGLAIEHRGVCKGANRVSLSVNGSAPEYAN